MSTAAATALDRVRTVRRAGGATLHLRRAWPRSADHLLLELVDASGGTVAGQWWRDPARAASVLAATPGAEGVGDDVVLQPDGADRRLVGLRPTLDRHGAVLVVHRPERRAVVRLGDGGTSWVKVVRPDRVADVVGRGQGVAATGIATPRLLDVDPGLGTTRWSHLPGRTLHELLAGPGAGAAVAATAGALAALHASRPAGDDPPHHGPAAEAEVLDRWIGHLLAHRPADAGALAEVAAAVGARLAALPGELASLIHRDLHDKQVLIDDGQVGVLDLDTLALGDPTLDVANLLAHLELRALQGRGSTAGARRLQELLLVSYGADLDPVGLEAHLGATYLRLACVYAFRPRWQHLAPNLVRLASCTGQLVRRR